MASSATVNAPAIATAPNRCRMRQNESATSSEMRAATASTASQMRNSSPAMAPIA